MFDAELLQRATMLMARCAKAGITISAAESCTGGLVSALLTEIAGSSAVFGFGFVTYANDAKMDLLGVSQESLARYGAVSPQTAEAMARGALARSGATLAVAITGIAGPGGGSTLKPVGLVQFALVRSDGDCRLVERRFSPAGRSSVRLAALDQALSLLEHAASQVGSPP